MEERCAFLQRGEDFAVSAHPTLDEEDVLVQIWFNTQQEAFAFALGIRDLFKISVASIDFTPVEFFDCFCNELHDFPEEKVNTTLRGFTACVSFLF